MVEVKKVGLERLRLYNHFGGGEIRSGTNKGVRLHNSNVFVLVFLFFNRSGLYAVLLFVAALEAQKELGFEQKDIDDIRSMITDTSINYLILILIATVTHTVLEVASVKSSYVFWRDNESLEGLSLIYVLGDFFSQGEVGDRVRVRASPRSLGTRCRSGRTQADRPRSLRSLMLRSLVLRSLVLRSLVLRSLTNPSPLS